MVLLESMFCGFWAFCLVLVICEAGQKLSDSFEEVEDDFGQIDWYLLPLEIQRMLPTILIYLQDPMVVRFFGSLTCCRELFKNVMPKPLISQIYKIERRLVQSFFRLFVNFRWWMLGISTSWYFVNFTNKVRFLDNIRPNRHIKIWTYWLLRLDEGSFLSFSNSNYYEFWYLKILISAIHQKFFFVTHCNSFKEALEGGTTYYILVHESECYWQVELIVIFTNKIVRIILPTLHAA